MAGRPFLSLVRCPDGQTLFAQVSTTDPGSAAGRGSAVWQRRHSAGGAGAPRAANHTAGESMTAATLGPSRHGISRTEQQSEGWWLIRLTITTSGGWYHPGG